jgi:hypothetical protein
MNFFGGVHSTIGEWDKTVAVNPQLLFANLIHPNISDVFIIYEKLCLSYLTITFEF